MRVIDMEVRVSVEAMLRYRSIESGNLGRKGGEAGGKERLFENEDGARVQGAAKESVGRQGRCKICGYLVGIRN